MTTMADITIKAYDGLTDVVYSSQVGSAGDRSPSVWRVTAASVIPMHRPSLTLTTRDNGPKTGRLFNMVSKFPVINPENERPVIVASIPISISGTLPTNIDVAYVQEAVYQTGNLFVSQLIRDSLVSGYSPN